jgi:hypothetical protein
MMAVPLLLNLTLSPPCLVNKAASFHAKLTPWSYQACPGFDLPCLMVIFLVALIDSGSHRQPWRSHTGTLKRLLGQPLVTFSMASRWHSCGSDQEVAGKQET